MECVPASSETLFAMLIACGVLFFPLWYLLRPSVPVKHPSK